MKRIVSFAVFAILGALVGLLPTGLLSLLGVAQSWSAGVVLAFAALFGLIGAWAAPSFSWAELKNQKNDAPSGSTLKKPYHVRLVLRSVVGAIALMGGAALFGASLSWKDREVLLAFMLAIQLISDGLEWLANAFVKHVRRLLAWRHT